MVTNVRAEIYARDEKYGVWDFFIGKLHGKAVM